MGHAFYISGKITAFAGQKHIVPAELDHGDALGDEVGFGVGDALVWGYFEYFVGDDRHFVLATGFLLMDCLHREGFTVF